MKSGRTDRYETFSVIKKLRNAEGYTLIEVLIAMAILAVGLLAIATMQISSIRVNTAARKMTERATIAQDKVEELVALSYTDAALNSGSHTDGSPPSGYTVSWTVSTGGTLPDNTKLIKVKVSKGGKTTSMSYIKPEF